MGIDAIAADAYDCHYSITRRHTGQAMTGELGADIVERYNDSPIAAAALPALTSVRPPYARIVTEVLRLIEIGPGNPTHISLTPELVVRASSSNRLI